MAGARGNPRSPPDLARHFGDEALRGAAQKSKRICSWSDHSITSSARALLVLQIFLLFVALPLAATGVPIAQPVAWLLLLLAVTLVVILSQRGVAIVTILLGLAAAAASFALGRQWSPITASVLNHGGFILAFSALIWVVAHALYAPGRITFHRLQGAMVVYRAWRQSSRMPWASYGS